MSVLERFPERFPVGDTGHRDGWRPPRPWDTDRAARDRVYTPSSCVANVETHLREYADRSAQARRLLPWRAIRYGADNAETLHFFPAAHFRASLHVFIHGGYWQELSEAESSFAAWDFVSRGSAFAALGYGLAPQHRLDEIVTMVRKGVRYLHRHATALGVHPKRIFLSGSSAGAHLANALRQLGAPVADLVVPGRNHFDLPLGLGDPADLLGSAVLAQMELTAVTEKECG